MSFYKFLEVVEPNKPSGKVIKKSVTKDPGTNVARKIIEFRYKTKIGNEIKLQFVPKYDDGYEVIFYVNDVLYDRAPQMGMDNKEEKYARDPEILSSIFYLLKDKADKMKAKYLTFRAFASANDTKIIRNLDIDPPKYQALLALNNFKNQIQSHNVTLLHPSENLKAILAKTNKPVPPPRPDLDKSVWLGYVDKVHDDIENKKDLQDDIDILLSAQGIKTLPINTDDLIEKLKLLNNAFQSNTEKGYARTHNRRAAIYEKILKRYFSTDWDIFKDKDRFTLKRTKE